MGTAMVNTSLVLPYLGLLENDSAPGHAECRCSWVRRSFNSGWALARSAMTEVEIEFCVPCGLYRYATEVQDAVIKEYGERLDSVRLTPGHGGVFKIYADGDLIWNKSVSKDGLDYDEIVADVGEYVGVEA